VSDEKADSEEKTSSAVEIVKLVEDRYELGRTPDGMLWAAPRDAKLARRATELRSIRPAVTRDMYRLQGRVPGATAVSAAFDTLQGIAASAPVEEAHLRAARAGRAVHIDLGDRDGSFVEVSPYGWELRHPDAEDDAGAARPLFRLTAATHPLPPPERGGRRDDLRELLGLAEDDRRWRLIWGWLVLSFLPDIPRPLLWVTGPMGSGKTTRAKMILDLVDPANELGGQPGKNERDDTTAAAARYVPTWDNIGNISAAVSDWLCRLVTGVAIDRRALYTDDDLRIRTLRRSGIATSITLPYGLGPDALERLVLVPLERIAEGERRTESTVLRDFERLRPKILGAILDDLAGVLSRLSRLQDAESAGTFGLPLQRMADYHLGLIALDMHVAEEGRELGIAESYAASVKERLAQAAEDDPFPAAVKAIVGEHGGLWSGTARELRLAVDPKRPDDPRAGWPHSDRGVSDALARNEETLRHVGVTVERRKTNGKRVIVLTGPAEPRREASESGKLLALPVAVVPDLAEVVDPS
jgi:hypothetical protein